MKEKKIKIKNEMVQDVDMMLATGVVDDEDEEMQSVASSDDEPSKPRFGGDDDEDSEEGWCPIISLTSETSLTTLLRRGLPGV